MRFLTRAEFEAHEARVCIHDGALLADPAARAALFGGAIPEDRRRRWRQLFADAPELLANTVEVAKRCSLRDQARASPCCRRTRCRPAAPPRISCAQSRSAGSRPARCGQSPPRRAAGTRLRLDLELGVICDHGLCRLLLDRRRFHPLGARQRRAGGTGPRLGRGLAGGLRARASPIWIRSSTICCSSAS